MIMPTQTELQALLDYDPLTGELTWKPRTSDQIPHEAGRKAWNTRYANKPAFTSDDGYGYKTGAINYVLMKAHRVIWKMVYGYDPVFIDHEDHNRSNNRLTNLRDSSRVQNQQNQKKKSTNSSGTTGVWFDQPRNRWDAFIGLNGRRKYLGRFKTEQEAIQARANAEILYDYHPNHGL